MTIESGAMLGILEEAGTAIMILTEGLEPDEFFSSRITQHEVLRQMQVIAATMVNIPKDIQQEMQEIDWQGWSALGIQLNLAMDLQRDALWFGVRSLVPAMLMWLRVYRKNMPMLFSLTA
jgi:uncharacterized protein with HEPN domain